MFWILDLLNIAPGSDLSSVHKKEIEQAQNNGFIILIKGAMEHILKGPLAVLQGEYPVVWIGEDESNITPMPAY